jgi:DNA invertase Pin-like site-specific DNA recombinase
MSYIPPPTTLPVGSKVWAYLRDSGGEAQEQSTVQQRKEIEAYCKEYGLILVRIFEDVARSAGSSNGRIAFLDMVEKSSIPERPAGLLVWNYARFARDMDDSAFYRALLRKNGMVVHSLTDPIPAGEFSRVIESLIDYANEEKRHQNSRDVKRALAERVRAGYSPGGKPPRGYLAKQETIGTKRNGEPRIGSRWVIDPILGPLVTLAFGLRAEGKSLREITRATQDRLYRDKNSWTTFFRNRSYLGIGKCGTLEIDEHHLKLVSPATFKTVQEISERARLNNPGNLLHPRRIASPSLLSGLAVCIHCDSAMVKSRAGLNQWPYYICGKKIRVGHESCKGRATNARKADQVVLDVVLRRILTPQFASILIEEMRSQFANTAELDRREQENQLAFSSVEKSISKLLDAIEETDSRSAKDRLKLRENERIRIQSELEAIRAQREAAHFDISPAALGYVLDVWRGNIESAQRVNDIRGQQSVLRQFVQKIELGYGIARVWYSYPLGAFRNTERASYPMGAHHVMDRLCRPPRRLDCR